MSVADLIVLLQGMPQDLTVRITNGDLPDADIGSVTVQAAGYGQLVLIARV
jgi:hypothetical protein